jgi:hypothetical protein
VACPFFVPVRQIGPGRWDPAPRLPLGDAWAGECWSASAAFTPSESDQREMCNTGYARGSCSRFPESAAADAVRFSIARAAETEGGEAGLPLVRYVLEKDHFPVEHGEIGPSTEGREILNRQARAFLETLTRRAGPPSRAEAPASADA